MQGHTTVIAGIPLPSDSPVFLALVGLHVLVALTCVLTGIVAMLSTKQPGRHPWFGTVYYWCLLMVFASTTALALMRWAEDYQLFILGACSFCAAAVGRTAHRRRWSGWVKIHISGMGLSYILLLTAFYVDNGENLPVWRDLPQFLYWVLPAAVGVPLIIRALIRHPLARRSGA